MATERRFIQWPWVALLLFLPAYAYLTTGLSMAQTIDSDRAPEFDQAVEARGYFEAVQATLSTFTTVDVAAMVETTFDGEGVLVPMSVCRWRLRHDLMNRQSILAFTRRKIDLDDAMNGRLDNWQLETIVIKVNDGKTSHFRPNRRTSRASFEDFETAITKVPHPSFRSFGLDTWERCVWNPDDTWHSKLRILANAAKISVGPQVAGDAVGAIAIAAVLDDPRLIEKHRWGFGNHGTEPISYSVEQIGRKSGARKLIASQAINWTDDKEYGRTPTSCLASIRMLVKKFDLKHPDTTERYVSGVKKVDVELNWLPFAVGSGASFLAMQSYTQQDVDDFVSGNN